MSYILHKTTRGGCLSNSHHHQEDKEEDKDKKTKKTTKTMRKLTWLTKMYVEFLLLSFFITDNESFERPLLFTPFRSMMMMMMKFERVDVDVL